LYGFCVITVKKESVMKKLLIAMVALVLSTGAMAQFRHGYYGGHGFYRSNVGVSVGFGYPYYGYYGYPYYYPYGPTYYSSGYPSKLELKVEDINNQCDYKISLVKNDKGLSHKEKRAEKRQLRYQRDQAIIQAKRDYYNSLAK
jgi:hypothetical protein